MSPNPLFERANLIAPHDLADYLRLRGWSDGESGPRYWIFQSSPDDHGQFLEVAFPRSNDVTEYERRSIEVIELLAEIEHCDFSDMVERIVARRVDRIEFRFGGEFALDSGMPLHIAARAVESIKNSLAFAAMHEWEPRPWFYRRSSRGNRYVANCRLGHTRAGSFVFVIGSPILVDMSQSVDEQLDLGFMRPYHRRVVERYVRGLMATAEARSRQSPEPLLDTLETGWNGNVCDTVKGLTESMPTASLEIDVRWSASRPPTADLSKFHAVELTRPDIQWLESATSEFRGEEPVVDATVTVIIIENRSPGTPPSDAELSDIEYARQLPAGHRDAPAITVRQEGWSDARRIHASLTYDDWQAAGAAQLELQRVRVSGRLVRSGNRWRLLNAKNLEILDSV